MKAILKADRKVIVDVIPLLIIDKQIVMFQEAKKGLTLYDHKALELIEYYGG